MGGIRRRRAASDWAGECVRCELGSLGWVGAGAAGGAGGAGGCLDRLGRERRGIASCVWGVE